MPRLRMVDPEVETRLLQLACHLCGGSFDRGFPGSQAVTLERARPPPGLADPACYSVTVKADGTRFLAIITGGRLYLVHRDGSVSKVVEGDDGDDGDDGDGGSQAEDAMARQRTATLLDVELVARGRRSADATAPDEVMLLVFDAICVAGRVLTDEPLDVRLATAQRFLRLLAVAQRSAAPAPRRGAVAHPFARLPGGLHAAVKDFFPARRAPFVVWSYADACGFATDGLVFTPWADAYRPGVGTRRVVKWKPPGCNTVDFVLHWANRAQMEGAAGGLLAKKDNGEQQVAAEKAEEAVVESVGSQTRPRFMLLVGCPPGHGARAHQCAEQGQQSLRPAFVRNRWLAPAPNVSNKISAQIFRQPASYDGAVVECRLRRLAVNFARSDQRWWVGVEKAEGRHVREQQPESANPAAATPTAKARAATCSSNSGGECSRGGGAAAPPSLRRNVQPTAWEAERLRRDKVLPNAHLTAHQCERQDIAGLTDSSLFELLGCV